MAVAQASLISQFQFAVDEARWPLSVLKPACRGFPCGQEVLEALQEPWTVCPGTWICHEPDIELPETEPV